MEDEVRRRIERGSILIGSISEVRKNADNYYNAYASELHCPHCLTSVIRRSFSQNERFHCTVCRTDSLFIIWSKARKSSGYMASLSPIN